MKILLLLLTLFSVSTFAKDEAAARELFEKYITSFEKSDVEGLLRTMDPYFLRETGGKEHWKEVVGAFAKDYKGAKVVKVELAIVKDQYFGRFNFSKKNEKAGLLTDKWFQLTLVNDKFLLHDFIDHFDPKGNEH